MKYKFFLVTSFIAMVITAVLTKELLSTTLNLEMNSAVTPSQVGVEETGLPVTTSATPANTTTLVTVVTPVTKNTHDEPIWVDETVDLENFPLNKKFAVHFKTAMSTGSSNNPVLTWPTIPGKYTWNATGTEVTFEPESIPDVSRYYTFFIDPKLQTSSRNPIQKSPEWLVHFAPGPQVSGTLPANGAFPNNIKDLEVYFSRKMQKTLADDMLIIDPPVPHQLSWTDDQTLKITLTESFTPGKRYTLMLKRGKSLVDESGLMLDKDYFWFYSIAALSVKPQVTGADTLDMLFNYPIVWEKDKQYFTITPDLPGKWVQNSSQLLKFIADKPISSTTSYELHQEKPLVDIRGFETSQIPPLSFTGQVPLRLDESSIEPYSGAFLSAPPDLNSFALIFDRPVDHQSAEKAFKMDPATSGWFSWKKENDRETMTFVFSELLMPGSTYTITMDQSIRDVNGEALITSDYLKSVYIYGAGYDRGVSFGDYGANIQVVDSKGSRSLELRESNYNVHFSAFRFELVDYAQLYAKFYKSRSNFASAKNEIPIPDALPSTAEWTWTGRQNYPGGNDYTVLPGEMLPGLYVINVDVDGTVFDQMFVVLTHNALVVKNDGDDLFVWLTEMNGGIQKDVEIRVYNAEGQKVFEGKTDENGEYRVHLPSTMKPLMVSARVRGDDQPEDISLVGFSDWESDIPNQYWNEPYSLPSGKPYQIYTYTERPIYKPGQIVNFKTIVRKDNDVRYTLPDAGLPVKLRFYDGKGNLIDTAELATNQFGTANGTYQLAEGAGLGDYRIETEVEGFVARRYFKVEDYKKPDYQVKLTPVHPEKNGNYAQGEKVEYVLEASYYFGEPLRNARVDVRLHHYLQNTNPVNKEIMTDENGKATISFTASSDGYFGEYYYWWGGKTSLFTQMEVVVDDGSNQKVSVVRNLQIYPAAEYATIDTNGYFKEPGKSFTATIYLKDLMDQPVAGRDLELETNVWDNQEFEFGKSEKIFNLRTDSQGAATIELTLPSGYQRIRIKGKDDAGNQIVSGRTVYVFNGMEKWSHLERSTYLSITTEKTSYKPYEKARLAIESTFSGPALLSFERGSVINTRMIELKAPLTIIDTEIIPEHSPNVFIMVNAWQPSGNEKKPLIYDSGSHADQYLRIAKTQIKVDASDKALDIQITPEKKTYAPGETLKAEIQVNGGDGKPEQAELSLAVVDEAIFALANDNSPDIFESFYGPRGLSVDTYDSMAPWREILHQGKGGGGDPGPSAEARSDFPDTSAWLPVVQTDANGHAVVEIKLPDNTTSWRLSVKAITLDHHVGQTFTNIETKKEVFVRPLIPRVLTYGDHVNLPAFIHNYSGEEKKVSVNLTANGLEVTGNADIDVTLKPGEALPISWPVMVNSSQPGEMVMTVTDETGVLDAIRLPLPLQPSAIRDVSELSGRFNGSISIPIPVPGVDREASNVRLSINKSLNGTLLGGMDYLIGYPYGCVEQTMSKALPNAVVARAADKLGIGGPELKVKLDPMIKEGIQKLYSLQHDDGGWGWWADDDTDEYQTAWVLYGLGVMKEDGYLVEQKVMDDAAKWLEQLMKDSDDTYDRRTRAFVLFSLAEAGHGDLDKTRTLVLESIHDLDPFSQGVLALALDRQGQKEEARAVLDVLSEGAIHTDDTLFWLQPDYDGEYYNKTMSSSVRTAAIALMAYAKIDPQNPAVDGLVNYLKEKRKGFTGWGTTNETSYSILALTEYLSMQETFSEEIPYEVKLNGTDLRSGVLKLGNQNSIIEIPAGNLNSGMNTLELISPEGSTLYYSVSMDYYLEKGPKAASGLIKITRRYIDPLTGKVVDRITPGKLVRIEMTVEAPKDVYYMAVEDNLPGGLEALTEGLNSIDPGRYLGWGEGEWQVPFYWQDYGYNNKEIRSDKTVFFITHFWKGEHKFKYFARAITPGEFTALPAQAYTMYDLSLWGRSDTTRMIIGKEEKSQ